MFQEFQFEDTIFGIFPKAGPRVSSVYGSWAKNSVGDIIEIVMQMLEVCFIARLFAQCISTFISKGLAFIHEKGIAHRVSAFIHTGSVS